MPSAAIRRHHPADFGGARFQQRAHGGPEVPVGQHGVPVDAGDDGVPRGFDGGVHGRGDLARWIGHDRDPAVGGGKLAGDRLGPVPGRADGQDQLESARVLLLEHAGDGVG
jgi:hypothetical protein